MPLDPRQVPRMNSTKSAEGLIDPNDSYRLKRHLKNSIEGFQEAVVKYEECYPCILIEYTKHGEKKTIRIKDMIQANKGLAEDRLLVESLYRSLY